MLLPIRMFNVLFEKGIYTHRIGPRQLLSLFIKRNIEQVDNYRGVSLLSVVSKGYTSVFNARLYPW